MLSTAQSYRPGHASEQHHISQATLDEQAIVFTTHPKNEPQSGTQWPDDDGYWTGNGSLPRAAQHGALVDQPLRAGVREPRAAAHRVPLPRLHPRVLPAGAVRRGRAAERLDVRAQGQRLRRAVVVAADAVAHVHRPGDLHPRAARSRSTSSRRGGADDVWFTQVGDADAVPRLRGVPRRGARATRCRSQPRPAVGGAGRAASTCRYESPTEGARQLRDHRRRCTVKGADVALDTGKRYDNPWALADFGASAITIADKAGALKLDFAHGSRVTSVTGR